MAVLMPKKKKKNAYAFGSKWAMKTATVGRPMRNVWRERTAYAALFGHFALAVFVYLFVVFYLFDLFLSHVRCACLCHMRRCIKSKQYVFIGNSDKNRRTNYKQKEGKINVNIGVKT